MTSSESPVPRSDGHPHAAEDPAARSVWLADGRRMGYAEFGDPNGVPVLFFHGTPGSRLSGALLADHAEAAGVRLLAPDRPGFGLSSFQQGHGRLEWPLDVVELADELGIERFIALGWSAGGPYALACAAVHPDRVSAVGVLAGVDKLRHLHPRLVKNLLSLRVVGGNPDRWSDAVSRAWVRTKKAAGSSIEATQAAASTIAAGIREGVRESTVGVLHELRLLSRDWDFDPADIAGVPVRFWHGLDDALISTRHARTLAARIPGAQATYLPEAGHVTLLTVHGREILTELRRLAT
ncbi:alpha/beta fold hydrolase [Granulicoccus sp. GXG6511]|uniref:alpha/beta fold hydrolase n=1 Tax=Granulicoccus sp. GXG6511 TaxID=3381351 RepID=UPI003D7F07F4